MSEPMRRYGYPANKLCSRNQTNPGGSPSNDSHSGIWRWKHLSRGWLLVGMGSLGLWLGSCGGGVATSPRVEDGGSGAVEVAPLQVVATTSVLCDLTQQILRADSSGLQLTCLMEPGANPHSYQPTPQDRRLLEAAALVLYDGYDASPRILQLLEGAGLDPSRQVAVYEVAVPNPLVFQGDAHDHAHDDGHDPEPEPAIEEDPTIPKPDPHVWHRAVHNGAIVSVITEALMTLNPSQASVYQQQGQALEEEFSSLETWIINQVQTIPPNHRWLVTPHDAFRYYGQAYGLEVEGILSGLSGAERPSPRQLQSLVDDLHDRQIPALFAQRFEQLPLLGTIAQDAQIPLITPGLYAEGPGAADSDAPTMQKMLAVNTCTIVTHLGGTCTPP